MLGLAVRRFALSIRHITHHKNMFFVGFFSCFLIDMEGGVCHSGGIGEGV